MKIAIDISPLKGIHSLWHRVRGTGFYIENLKSSLLSFYPDNNYIFFSKGEKLPKDVDIVHYPYFEPFFRTLPFKKKAKTVVTVHDLTPLIFPKNFPCGIKGRIKWQIQRTLLKRADAIITDSECSRKDVIEHVGVDSTKVHTVYLAAGAEFKIVQSSKFLPRSSVDARRGEAGKIQNFREKYKLPGKFVLYVGDVTWNKNLPRLLEAIKKINVPLVMVGKALGDKGFDRTNPWNQDLIQVQKIAEKNSKLLLLGFVPTEDLVMLYNIATVFVMPSIYEGFGLPVLEAMSCGCPVVTTKGGSLAEVAGEAALFVDPYDSESIASGIENLFKDEDLQKDLSKKGIEQAIKFSWQKTAKKTIRVYEEKI